MVVSALRRAVRLLHVVATSSALTICTATLLLVGCSPGPDGSSAAPSPVASSGQIAPQAYKVSYYAAARFAEQATFGPTPALIEELRTKGFEQWIDEQLAMPFSLIDPGPTTDFSGFMASEAQFSYLPWTWTTRALSARDQLRHRMVWSLGSFLVASLNNGEPLGHVTWLNLLHQHAFGNYRDLLRSASVDRHMGAFLNNDQNRPKSAECPHCAPNENFARELMQLFSIGVVKLNGDGTAVKDAQGRLVETYSQQDVEELSRVLTGWTTDPNPANRPQRNGANWGRPMVPSTWAAERDAGSKRVLGRIFPAGQSTQKDLDDAIDLLVSHPNAAPFVTFRLIQQFVKSSPTPAYVGRISAVFRDNGRGGLGDLKAVVKAILLDPEARRGDDPASADRMDGKFREPFMHHMALVRGLGCQRNFETPDGKAWSYWRQPVFRPSSVFGFYAPTDRAPGSDLLAPEQKLVNSEELSARFGWASSLRWEGPDRPASSRIFNEAGCDIGAFSTALASSSRAFIDLVSLRYFRGAMPPTLRNVLTQLIDQRRQGLVSDWDDLSTQMLSFALATPAFGVMK